MAGQLNFEEFKKDFFEELAVMYDISKYSIFNKRMRDLFEKVEFQNQTAWDSKCKVCGCLFNLRDGQDCPQCGSNDVERNLD